MNMKTLLCRSGVLILTEMIDIYAITSFHIFNGMSFLQFLFLLKVTEERNQRKFDNEQIFQKYLIAVEEKSNENMILKKDLFENKTCLEDLNKTEKELFLLLEDKENQLSVTSKTLKEIQESFDLNYEELKISKAAMIENDENKEEEINFLKKSLTEIKLKNISQLKEQKDLTKELTLELNELKSLNNEKEKLDSSEKEKDFEISREKEEKNQMNLKREERDMIRNEINKEELSKKFQVAIEEKEKEINRLTSLSSDYEKDLSVAQMEIQR